MGLTATQRQPLWRSGRRGQWWPRQGRGELREYGVCAKFSNPIFIAGEAVNNCYISIEAYYGSNFGDILDSNSSIRYQNPICPEKRARERISGFLHCSIGPIPSRAR